MGQQYTDNASAREVRAALVGKTGLVPAPIPFLEQVHGKAWLETEGDDLVVQVEAVINQQVLKTYGMQLSDVIDTTETTDGRAGLQLFVWTYTEGEDTYPVSGGTPALIVPSSSAIMYAWNAAPADPTVAEDLADWVTTLEQAPIIGAKLRIGVSDELGYNGARIHAQIRPQGLGKYVSQTEWARRFSAIPVHVSAS